jgi:long-chain fatty acid transport protein
VSDRILAALAAFIMVGPAHAGNQDLYGFGARGPALGGASVAFARGFEAIWYNPAGLVDGGARAFTIGFQATSFDLEVLSPRPESVEGAADQEPISGVTLGVNVVIPLTGWLQDRIALGLGLYIPTQTLLSAQIPRPYSPQFSLVADRARTLSISAAIAFEFTEWLRLGVGVRALAGLTGLIEVAPNELGAIGSNVEDQLVARYSPLIGIWAAPHPDVAIGLAFRGALGGTFDLPVRADLGDALPLQVPELRIAGMAVYDPGQISAHIGWKPNEHISVESGITWRQWSEFPTPIENSTVALPAQPPLDFRDTIAPRIGFESPWDLGSWRLTGRLGYAWEPTPVPDQTDQHNFLDSDRHVVGWGLGVGYGAPGERFRVDIDLYGQVHVLSERFATKDLDIPGDAFTATDNKGFPWIGHSGRIVSFGAAVAVQL